MKSLLLLPLLGFVSVAACAQSSQALDSVDVPAPLQRIDVPAKALRMAQIDYGRYRGAYDLANGQTLYLTAQGRRMYAEVDDGGKSEIVGAGHGVFVALDQRMKMSFEPLQNGDLGGELLLAKTPMIAGQPVEYVSLMARR